jgi:deoxyribodipyrimidine photo-lyase
MNVPIANVHEPWIMTKMEQIFCSFIIGEDCPISIVVMQESARITRYKIWEH